MRFAALDGPWRGAAVGSVLEIALHGALESPATTEALVGARLQRTLDEKFDRLADAVEPHLPDDRLLDMAMEAA